MLKHYYVNTRQIVARGDELQHDNLEDGIYGVLRIMEVRRYEWGIVIIKDNRITSSFNVTADGKWEARCTDITDGLHLYKPTAPDRESARLWKMMRSQMQINSNLREDRDQLRTLVEQYQSRKTLWQKIVKFISK